MSNSSRSSTRRSSRSTRSRSNSSGTRSVKGAELGIVDSRFVFMKVGKVGHIEIRVHQCKTQQLKITKPVEGRSEVLRSQWPPRHRKLRQDRPAPGIRMVEQDVGGGWWRGSHLEDCHPAPKHGSEVGRLLAFYYPNLQKWQEQEQEQEKEWEQE